MQNINKNITDLHEQVILLTISRTEGYNYELNEISWEWHPSIRSTNKSGVEAPNTNVSQSAANTVAIASFYDVLTTASELSISPLRPLPFVTGGIDV